MDIKPVTPGDINGADLYGVVMVLLVRANGKGNIWQATKYGKIIFSHPDYHAARDGAIKLLD